ncbi:MAG: S26 family signal peptidase, partial [Acidimicrobiales bacterium]
MGDWTFDDHHTQQAAPVIQSRAGLAARRRGGKYAALAGGLLALLGGAVAVIRPRRVVVTGRSMEPTLSAGDRLLVGRLGSAKVGDIVALRDPTNQRRVIVKRVTAVRRDEIVVRGDNSASSVDSRSFGPA